MAAPGAVVAVSVRVVADDSSRRVAFASLALLTVAMALNGGSGGGNGGEGCGGGRVLEARGERRARSSLC